ncbi:MAG: hypothetical protein KGL69_05270 [Alphaproteobacteria bacterium]|jgi:hypothetical protein|nr:hypothetical protein [Alphaproteobacteria bacterium]
MTKTLLTSLAAGAAALALASVSHAQATPDASAAPIPSAAGAPSVESTPISDLVADPAAHAVLEKDFPKLLAYPGLDDIKGMTLRAISAFPEADLDETKLKAIQADLDAAAKK